MSADAAVEPPTCASGALLAGIVSLRSRCDELGRLGVLRCSGPGTR